MIKTAIFRWTSIILLLTLLPAPAETTKIENTKKTTTPTESEHLTFDLTKTAQTFLGFGAQIWPYCSHEKYPDLHKYRKKAIDELNIRYVRITRERASIKDLQKTRQMTDKLGVKWIYMIWSTGRRFSEKRNLNDIEGFADWWLDEVQKLHADNIPIEYIELMNEPDSRGQWSTGITPDQYARLVTILRKKLDAKGFTNVGIVGPGLSSLSWSRPAQYLNAMDANSAAAIAAWSTHTWADDTPDCGPLCIEKHWPKFAVGADRLNPSIPKFVTEYSTKMRFFHGVEYPMPDDYGKWNDDNLYPYYSSSNTVPFAARAFANTLALLNSGASVLCYWQLNDEPTEVSPPGFRDRKHKSWGIIDLHGKPKPPYLALKTLYPNIPIGAKVIAQPNQRSNDLYASCLTHDNKVILAVANDKASTISTTITLKNAPAGLKVVNALAFEMSVKGNPHIGQPDKPKVTNKKLKLIPIADSTYTLNLTLPQDSTITIICKK